MDSTPISTTEQEVVPESCARARCGHPLEKRRRAQPWGRPKADIFKELVFDSHLPLDQKRQLIARYNERGNGIQPKEEHAQQEPGHFHQFRKLPPEVRHLIWQEAAPPRVLNMMQLSYNANRARMPIVASVCREAWWSIAAIGRRDLCFGFDESRDPDVYDHVVHRKCAGMIPNCSFVMPRDVVYYDRRPNMHQLCIIPTELETSTVAVRLHMPYVFPDHLNYIMNLDEGTLDKMIKGEDRHKTMSFIRDWAFLKDIPTMQTLYVRCERHYITYELCDSYMEWSATCNIAASPYSSDLSVSCLVDLDDSNRLGEVLSLDTPIPDAGKYGNYRDAPDVFDGCLQCVRQRWETKLLPGLEMLWVMLHMDELQQSDLVALLVKDGKGLDKSKDWVEEKLTKMPKIRPFVELVLDSSWTRL